MRTEYDDAFKWCIENDIIIYPIVWKEATTYNPPRCAIQVDYQGYKRTGDYIFKQDKKESKEMYSLIRKLYVSYYRKRNKHD